MLILRTSALHPSLPAPLLSPAWHAPCFCLFLQGESHFLSQSPVLPFKPCLSVSRWETELLEKGNRTPGVREERRRIGRAPEPASNKVLWQPPLRQYSLSSEGQCFIPRGNSGKYQAAVKSLERERGGENKSKRENTKHPQPLSGLSL